VGAHHRLAVLGHTAADPARAPGSPALGIELAQAGDIVRPELAKQAALAEQTASAAQFYSDLTGRAENGIMTGGTLETFVFWVITFVVNIWLIYRGISKGIEKFCSWAMPAMAVCALIVLGRVLTLGTPDPAFPEQNVVNGLGYMWNPNFEKLGDAQTWLAAAGQIFFTCRWLESSSTSRRT
jgi:SNF family Na+-dependent transporter